MSDYLDITKDIERLQREIDVKKSHVQTMAAFNNMGTFMKQSQKSITTMQISVGTTNGVQRTIVVNLVTHPNDTDEVTISKLHLWETVLDLIGSEIRNLNEKIK